MDRQVPVYIFTGLLDSGKTTCIKDSLRDPSFNEGEKTLIIAFEEGDEEYDDDFLDEVDADLVTFDSLDELTAEKMEELQMRYQPARIMIEMNGVQDDKDLITRPFYQYWILCQVLVTIDTKTFRNYSANMKQFIYNHVYFADLCIFNRCDGEDKRFLRNNIKAICPGCSIIYEDSLHNVTDRIDEQLFDLSKPIILPDEDYGLLYMEMAEDPQKYDDVEIALNLKVIQVVDKYDNVAIMGRPAMVCCGNDIRNISLTVVDIEKKDTKKGGYFTLHGKLKCVDTKTGEKNVVLYADDYHPIDKPTDEMVYFN